jgi:hypothetical protein
VRDFVSDLFERRIHQERTFRRDWWRGFRKHKTEGLLVSVGAAREIPRTEMTSISVLAQFNELKDALPTCMTPNQILTMNATGLSMYSMKGKKQMIV